jgi:uncharacterized phage-associated protein
MATVLDVAAYILSRQGPMTAMKLQKLVYYAQAWSLVWDEKPIFRNRIEAWANGPVSPALYVAHRGRFKVGPGDIKGDRSALTLAERATADAVLRHYGRRPSQWLSSLTHCEPPWKDARRGIRPGERGDKEITHAAMAEYYGSL